MKCFILLIALISTSGASFSQNITLFKNLPDTLKYLIKRDISFLTEKDSISGNLKYTEGGNVIGLRYKFFLNNMELVGYYSQIASCATCYSQWLTKNTKITVMYCCKDPSHKPQETARTKDDMLVIKKQKHCSKIGICMIE